MLQRHTDGVIMSKPVEIEKKFLIASMPENLESYKCRIIEQGYLCTDPVVRVRRSNDEYYLTYKGRGLLEREEYNLPLTPEGYEHLIQKADGNIIRKKRYLIPIEGSDRIVELDVFDPPFAPLVLAEVEFESTEQADAFKMLPWFEKEVTNDKQYQNSNMSKMKFETEKEK